MGTHNIKFKPRASRNSAHADQHKLSNQKPITSSQGLACEPPVPACEQCSESFVEGEQAIRTCPLPGSGASWRYLCTSCAPSLDEPMLWEPNDG